MASTAAFVDYLRDQLGAAGTIEFRKMFGEYAMYCDGKVVALVCDDQLFLKPTQAARQHLGRVVEAPPYPGARLYFLVQEALEDRALITTLVRLTADELPLPRPRKPRAAKTRKAAAR